MMRDKMMDNCERWPFITLDLRDFFSFETDAKRSLFAGGLLLQKLKLQLHVKIKCIHIPMAWKTVIILKSLFPNRKKIKIAAKSKDKICSNFGKILHIFHVKTKISESTCNEIVANKQNQMC